MEWNPRILRDDVEQVYGTAHRRLVDESSTSIVERQQYACYHFHEAKEIFNGYFRERTTAKESIDLIFRKSDSDRDGFDLIYTQTRAHIVAFMQSLHSISDILSHVVYYSLALDLSKKCKIEIDRLNIYNLSKFFECEKDSYASLLELINELTQNDDYKYLSDVVNHSKHRRIVEPSFTVNLRKLEGEFHEIRFREFDYKGKKHNARLAFDFMEGEFDRQNLLIIRIGNELNKIVRDCSY
ncbi:hypothetical protein [Pseudidiomarina sediminum]|uniref:hypothetical protein n=1 Tax=Pseudidiomarina sediminum TaxID=431675 RepID=UPI001C94C12E|nr:hypothetical protein [Pseudidiomarina sediminum]MBY6064564.1 hypothetical protein [Pseudidiomarina sediminum]